jgi:CRP-like cAMP-binding protein
MRLCSIISITACAVLKTAFAQVVDDHTAQRLAIVKQLVTDLKGDQENASILEKYLASSGKFSDTTTKRTADTWTSGLKESLSRFSREEIEVYNYSTRPEMVRRIRSIDSQDASQSNYVALRFAIETKRPNFSVVLEDLYVMASKDKTFKSYVLFDNQK